MEILPIEHPLLSAPRFLLDWPAWAAWAAPVKMPLDLRRGLKKADVTLPDTWASPRHAAEHLARAARLRPPSLPLTAGVGILVAPPLVFVDFDDLVDDTSSAPEWATTFLQRAATMGAFTEWSGSGTGAHAFIRTSPQFPTLTRNRYTRTSGGRAVGIEVYTGRRFAALTGFPYFPGARAELNKPEEGDQLLTAFIAELGTTAAPILTTPLGPIHVPPPGPLVLRLATNLSAQSQLARAFADPQQSFADWAADRSKRSLDDTLSAWRFHLFTIASRESPASPLPLYELFKPHDPTLQTLVAEWQEHSGYLRKPHRVYHDIQRAHALVQEEQRLLAIALGEPEPKRPAPPPSARHVANEDLAQSWAQLGLAMKSTRTGSAIPVAGTVNYIRLIAKHHHFSQWKIERNTLDGTTRVNRTPMPDTLATRFLEPIREILDMNSDPPIQSVRDSIEVVADDSPYDPLVEYLRSLPPYTLDEPSYLSTWLAEMGASPDHDLPLYSRRILLGLVARALRPGIKFDYVPVFEGPTGVGKSTLVSMLVTPPYFAVLATDLQSKDAKIALRGKWALEMAEMSAFKKSDEESRKAFFSTASDSFRPPYGRSNIDVMRRCVLFGTTEDRQYLSDWRGNRRFWPVRFEHDIDLKWFESHRDRLFAEAIHYFERGERIYDVREEMQAPQRLNALQERLVTPAWQVRLLEHLTRLPRPSLPEGETPGAHGVYTTQYIANAQRTLDLPPDVQRMSDAQLARFLHRAGFVSHAFSYRRDKKPEKFYCWMHPDLALLTEEQRKAFLSFFPEAVPGGTPAGWSEYRNDHLDAALQQLGLTE